MYINIANISFTLTQSMRNKWEKIRKRSLFSFVTYMKLKQIHDPISFL